MKKISKYVLFLALLPGICFADMKTNYSNVPLSSLVGTISKITKKTYTYNVDSAVVPVSLVMPEDKSPESVYSYFRQSLSVAGLKAVESSSGIVSILPASFVIPSDKSKDHFQTIVITLNNSKAGELSKALEKSLTVGGYIADSGDTKLVVHDLQSNLVLIRKLVRSLDYKSESETEEEVSFIVALNNLKPSDLKGNKSVQLAGYDSMHRVVVSGLRSDVQSYTKMIRSLDTSLKTVYARLLITSANSSFSDEFNLVAIFQKGALSTDLKSISVDTIGKYTDGITAVLSLFDQRNDVKILSKPFLQLTEGKQGSFSVGREVPFKTSTIDQSTGQSITTIERQTIGLSVDMLARVRPDGLISISVDQNLSSISEKQIDQSVDLITDTQSLKTSLLIEPGKVYAIGGLTDSRKTTGKTSVPLFSILDQDTESTQDQEITIFIETSMNPF